MIYPVDQRVNEYVHEILYRHCEYGTVNSTESKTKKNHSKFGTVTTGMTCALASCRRQMTDTSTMGLEVWKCGHG